MITSRAGKSEAYMIPSISYRRLIAFNNLKEYNSSQLCSSISSKSDCSLTDHDALLVNLDLSVQRCARRSVRSQCADIRQTGYDPIQGIGQPIFGCYLRALIKASDD